MRLIAFGILIVVWALLLRFLPKDKDDGSPEPRTPFLGDEPASQDAFFKPAAAPKEPSSFLPEKTDTAGEEYFK